MSRRERRAAERAQERSLTRPLWQQAIDITVIVVIGVAITLVFGPTFGGTDYLIAGIGGTLVGALVGVVTSLPRLRGVLPTAAAIVVAIFVFGPALAVRHKTIGGVIPTFEAWHELLLGTVFSWKDLLTAQPPVQGFPSLLVVPFLTLLLATAIASAVALRVGRLAPLAVVPLLVALAVSITLGVKTAAFPTLIGAIVAGVSIGWVAWRIASRQRALAREVEVSGDDTNRTAARRRLLLGASALLVGAIAAGSIVSLPFNFANRHVLRTIVEPPIDLQEYPSPLAGFRNWVKNFGGEVLFTVEGMPEDGRIPLATLDAYDGTVYAVAGSGTSGSGSFTRVGDVIETQQSGVPTELEFEVVEYSGVWMLMSGYATGIQFTGDRAEDLQGSLHYNALTGGAIVLDGLQPGDSYTIQTVIPTVPEHEVLESATVSSVAMPTISNVPEDLKAWVAENGTFGTTTLERIEHLTALLHTQGFFSHGLEGEVTSLAGHGAARIQQLFAAPQMIGDDEQYAVALSLALNQMGVPARVVMGFYPDDGFDDGVVELTGNDVHAWVEVPFEGIGWVPFDPTPPEDQVPQEEAPQPQNEPRAQVLQPPQPPEPPVELTPQTEVEENDPLDDPLNAGWVTVVIVTGLAILALVALVAAPFLIVGLMKSRRRTRRRTAQDPSQRLAGGWSEVVDTAIDYGVPVPRGTTRREVASVVQGAFPASRAVAIGDYVDAGVFGPGSPNPHEVDAFWRDVEVGVQDMQNGLPWRQRIMGRLSIRSFLTRTRRR